MKAYRHGEIALVVIDELPREAKKTNRKVLIKGSHGNPHKIDKGTIYDYENGDGMTFGLLEAKNTTLLHPEHGEGEGKLKEAKLPDGFYLLIKQQEIVNDEMKPVKD